jgi:predicted Zn-dependent peptidase
MLTANLATLCVLFLVHAIRRYYHPRNLTISVVGDVTPEQVQQLAEKYFGGWSPAATMEVIPLQHPEPLTLARPDLQVS